ncbi:4-amino-4-deoxy-L-arabinose transferase [Elysia marginata]|uniref:4-amino-4-deoxy-L-arabinose transferase n=1 Tax=Elysia marginata TaxID=1093978 RepID=A0AAV4F2X8_9GAST|nr:4-amino-4-deoxy-L-arabinose transferase [Elysia marginata]
MLGMILVTSLGMPACANPTANLYALFFAIAAFRVAAETDLFDHPGKLVLLGLMIGLCVLFRHLSGILLGCGLVTWLLSHPKIQHQRQPASRTNTFLGRLLLFLAFLGVAGYSINRSDLTGLSLFSFPALMIAVVAIWKARPDAKAVWRILLPCSLGLFLAFLPLAIYLSCKGIWQAWLQDIVILPLSLISMPFIETWRYSDLLLTVSGEISQITNTISTINYLTWIGLVLVPGIAGWFVARRFAVQFSLDNHHKALPAFVVCAPFYGLASLHFEIPLYLIWSIPPLLMTAFWLWGKPNQWQKAGFIGLAVITVGTQTTLVGAPVWERSFAQFVTTQPGDFLANSRLEGRAQINLTAEETDFYQRSLALIDENTTPSDSIFSFPSHPQWYFLSGRKNPTKHLFSGVSINSEYSLFEIEKQFTEHPPAMVIHKTNDKYGNPFTGRLRHWFDQHYQLIHSEKGFDFLVVKDRQTK